MHPGYPRRPWPLGQSATFPPTSTVVQSRPPLVMPTPAGRQIGSVDPIVNLLMTTLAVVVAALPPGKQLSDSAPQAKYQVQCDQYNNVLVRGYNPQPQVQQLSASAPYPKPWLGYADESQYPLTLGINPQPQVRQLSDSAPPPKAAVTVDQPTFHPLTLGMNPQPQVRQLSDSAPSTKYPIQVDRYPNLSVTTLAPPPFLPADVSQWQGKYQVQADNYPNTLVFSGTVVSENLTGQTITSAEGTILYEVDYSLTNLTGLLTEGTISATGGDIVVPLSQPGGSGKRRIKRSSEIFQEEMAKLERQATEATEQRVSIEEKIEESKYDPIPADIQRYIASFERALRRAEAYERSQNIEVPVLFRLPKKSAGVERVEAFKHLQSLARIARHREDVARERLRKVRERIDEEAAIYLMNFIMWDD